MKTFLSLVLRKEHKSVVTDLCHPCASVFTTLHRVVHLWLKTSAVILLFLLSPFSHAEMAYSSSATGDFAIFAEDQATADIAVHRAEEILEGLESRFHFRSKESGVPIVGVLNSSEPSRDEAEDDIRIFERNPGYKIQINWSGPRLPLSAYRRSWVRAFCLREAIHSELQKNPDAKELSVRVPFWITDGIAALLEDPNAAEATMARVSVLAKVERDFPLNGFCEGILALPERDPTRVAMEAMVCSQLLTSDEFRPRVLESLRWKPETTAREWLQMVLGNRDVEKWWQEIWNAQITRFSVLKLSVLVTEKEIAKMMGQDFSNPRNAALENVLNPWVANELEGRFPGEARGGMTKQDLLDVVSAVHSHRTAALTWLDQLPEGQLNREEWLNWKALRTEEASPLNGPISDWLGKMGR